MAERCSDSLEAATKYFNDWLSQKNLFLNNVDLLLTICKGQTEIDSKDTEPYNEEAVLLTERVLTEVNQEIEVCTMQQYRSLSKLDA